MWVKNKEETMEKLFNFDTGNILFDRCKKICTGISNPEMNEKFLIFMSQKFNRCTLISFSDLMKKYLCYSVEFLIEQNLDDIYLVQFITAAGTILAYMINPESTQIQDLIDSVNGHFDQIFLKNTQQ